MANKIISLRSTMLTLLWFLAMESIFLCLCSDIPEPSCIASERAAILTFKASLNDPGNNLASWEGEDCCRWRGVHCNNKTNHITGLNLDFYNFNTTGLSGEINPSLLHLKHLRRLDLSLNNFNGTPIPEFIGSFENLRYLNLSFSGFTGRVPPQIGNLSHLRYLDLESRLFFPPFLYVDNLRWLQHLSSLRHLNMNRVNLTAAIDWLEMANMLPSLTFLSLESSSLYFIPSYLPYINFTNLSTLNLADNNFIGIPIPEFIGSFENLRYLYLSFSGFTGRVPPQIGNLSHLRYLDLSADERYNLYVDNLRWLQHLSSLRHLDMYGVNLTAAIDWLEMANMLPSLSFLNLESSSLHVIPSYLPYINFTNLSTLNLAQNNFNSTLPPWICNISSLTNLNLQFNNFYGPIPDAIGNLVSIDILQLGYNGFYGPIPDAIGNLVSIEILQLGYNGFEGMIPSTMRNLCSLDTLDLYHNKISGEINELVERLPNCTEKRLKELILDDNMLSGKLPSGSEQMKSLQLLGLHHNKLDGPIPDVLGKLSELIFLDLSQNSFDGVVTDTHFANLARLKVLILSGNPSLTISWDESWVPSFQLKYIGLGFCRLGSHFPAWLGHQKEVSGLDLSSTGISGKIPEWFWKNFSPVIYRLDLSNNMLSGQLPESLEFAPYSQINLNSNMFEGPLPPTLSYNCDVLDLSNNSFSGPLPSTESPYLAILDLSNNLFSSNIPSSLGKASRLSYLDFSNNNLSGEIPDEWPNEYMMRYINLGNNHLSGTIPSSIGSLTELRGLGLSNNSLTGQFPSSLQPCINLLSLDLSRNKFVGTIPTWIGDYFQSLFALLLRSNMFSGKIPQRLVQLHSLWILDLGENNLSGPIPQSLSHLTAMASTVAQHSGALIGFSGSDYFNMFEGQLQHNGFLAGFGSTFYSISLFVFTKGEELEYTKNNYLLKSIDLSRNNLSGEIPEEIGVLAGLRNLNLSANRLEGEIPYNIGRLQSLESLDLSRNHLIGNIPQSISTIYSLNKLNLSHNNLSGRIPSGSQIQTLNDPSIYAGNVYLCGSPLQKNCSSNQTIESGNGDFAEEDGDEMVWFYISMGLGYVVGFWVACGVLLFKKTWRYAYFRFFDSMYDRLYVAVSLTLAKLKNTRMARN